MEFFGTASTTSPGKNLSKINIATNKPQLANNKDYQVERGIYFYSGRMRKTDVRP